MKGLLVKDIRLMLQQKRFFVMLLFIAVMLNFSTDGFFVIGYLTMAFSIFVISTISYDEFDNCYPFLMTLPVDRRSYVKEKYFLGLLLGGSAWLIGTIISLLNQMIQNEQIVFKDFFMIAVVYIPIFILLISIFIPFQLKYGSEKGRLVMIGATGIVFLVGYLFVKLAERMGVNIGNMVNTLSTLNIGVVEAILILVSVVGLGISCMISFKIMGNKEF